MTGPQSLTILDRPVPSLVPTSARSIAGQPDGTTWSCRSWPKASAPGRNASASWSQPAPAEVLERAGQQVDLDRTVETGQLELATPADAYLRSGTFSTDAMLSYWQHAAAAARGAKGSGMLRAAGEMPSVLDHPDGRTEFFRYEARLNGCIASLPAVILCLYDLQRFGAEVLMDTLRTHPMVVVDDMVHDNPYYVDPGEFLRGRE